MILFHFGISRTDIPIDRLSPSHMSLLFSYVSAVSASRLHICSSALSPCGFDLSYFTFGTDLFFWVVKLPPCSLDLLCRGNHYMYTYPQRHARIICHILCGLIFPCPLSGREIPFLVHSVVFPSVVNLVACFHSVVPHISLPLFLIYCFLEGSSCVGTLLIDKKQPEKVRARPERKDSSCILVCIHGYGREGYGRVRKGAIGPWGLVFRSDVGILVNISFSYVW